MKLHYLLMAMISLPSIAGKVQMNWGALPGGKNMIIDIQGKALDHQQMNWPFRMIDKIKATEPALLRASYTFTADIEIPEQGAEGMIVTHGGHFTGYGLYLLKGKPIFVWNIFDLNPIRLEGNEALLPGAHTLVFDFKYDGVKYLSAAATEKQLIRDGEVALLVDGKEVARQRMHSSPPLMLQWEDNFDIGVDSGTPVAGDYQVPFNFTGTIKQFRMAIHNPPC
ncbi:MAG: hypothetical protein BGO90_09480 [Legionella sp. 40-6]|nr:hypothetical protein [Legionella sp.]OJY43823.1 MAG: hypothetical protein BGO90_09480 [Legionella sp. 40-6]